MLLTEWEKSCGDHQTTWKQGMRKVTTVKVLLLCGWGARDSPTSWLERQQDRTMNHERWRTCCHSLKKVRSYSWAVGHLGVLLSCPQVHSPVTYFYCNALLREKGSGQRGSPYCLVLNNGENDAAVWTSPLMDDWISSQQCRWVKSVNTDQSFIVADIWPCNE